ncbi:MAG: prephenate dehydratase domain-containing protein [Nocardioides sp.]
MTPEAPGTPGARRIAYQGEPGANSHTVCVQHYPDWEAVPCASFEDVFALVEGGDAELAMIPIDNSIAGRVSDIHHFLPASRLHIVAEHFLRIRFMLMAVPGPRSTRWRRCTATSTHSASAARSSASSG